MPVTREQLNAMHHQLAEDKASMAGCEGARPYLDFQEKNIQDLEASWARRNPTEAKLEAARQLVGQDAPTEENIIGTFQEIKKAEAAIASLPEELKGEPEYAQGKRALELLGEHFEALNTKRTLQDRVQHLVRATSDLRVELQSVEKLLNENRQLSKEIAPVFEQIKTLAPALDVALDSPIQLPAQPEANPEPDPELERVFRIIGDGWRNLVKPTERKQL